MSTNIFQPKTLLGPLKINGTSKPESFGGLKEGWFYPLYTTREEAIQADISYSGKGIYQVVYFYGRTGEFYIPNSFANLGKSKDPLIFTLYTGNGAENPFKRITNRLSLLIQNQLPEFISSEYTTFVQFLKAYYEFLEQNNNAQEVLQNIPKYADIDKTSSEFVTKFIQNYATDYTLSNVADNRFLVKKIREIYSRKGTEPAYKLLFNILYKETVEFFYPWNVVLKASSGKWTTRYALRVKQITNENVFDFENTEILGKTSGARAIVTRVIKFQNKEFDIYELVLDTTTVKGFFLKDEEVEAQKTILLSEDTFSISPLKSRVYSVVSKIDIIDGGLGYEKGKEITISDGTGLSAKATIGGVNRYGSITKINIEDAGINYSSNTRIDAGMPTANLTGTYSMTRGKVQLKFSELHGLTIGKNIEVTYTGNVFSPVNNTTHSAVVTSVPTVKSIRYRYPGF